jgi:hypothetical protein
MVCIVLLVLAIMYGAAPLHLQDSTANTIFAVSDGGVLTNGGAGTSREVALVQYKDMAVAGRPLTVYETAAQSAACGIVERGLENTPLLQPIVHIVKCALIEAHQEAAVQTQAEAATATPSDWLLSESWLQSFAADVLSNAKAVAQALSEEQAGQEEPAEG